MRVAIHVDVDRLVFVVAVARSEKLVGMMLMIRPFPLPLDVVVHVILT